MKKIPTIFLRDHEQPRAPITRQENPWCDWVFRGEGIATKKLDGTCCMVSAGKLYKRREITPEQVPPRNFVDADYDETTGKRVGWVPVGDGPEDVYHRVAFVGDEPDGTYELVGPKIQGNPEFYGFHRLVRHDSGLELMKPPARDFDSLKAFFDGNDIEGIVYHHPDGRMAKIKGRDFGFKRPKRVTEGESK